MPEPELNASLMIDQAAAEQAAILDQFSQSLRHHHERHDGRGYPHGLTGTETPLMARILAVADSYDAMTSDRPYRKALSSDKAETVLMEHSGQQWDKAIVDAFFRCRHQIRRTAQDYVADPDKSILTAMEVGRGEAAIKPPQSAGFANSPSEG
jgi:HD-GYP domain-containing protein (c-di-GMP phosphodiesterase class II)